MGGVRCSLMVSAAMVGLVGSSVTAQAQVRPASAAPAGNSEAEKATDIIVTGTRISNSGVVAPTPLTVLDAAKIQQAAPSGVDDVLSRLPAFRSNSGPNQGQRNAGAGTAGQSFANLRGLGAQRTLTLIDGRRPVPTGAGNTTSTTIIPVGMIKRIEVVTGGASAAYGSDAVAGVTNFILVDRMSGLKGSIYGGISGHGDNKEIGANLVFGLNSSDDRFHLVAGADYNNNKGVGNIYSRDWSAVEPGNPNGPISFGATRAAGTPAFGFANGVEYAAQTLGGVITGATTATGAASTALNLLAFNPDGSTYTLVRGPVFGNLMIDSSSNHVATPIAQWNLRVPVKQFASMARLSYEISDQTSVFADINYARSKVFSYSQYHQSPTITIRSDNPYLPAGIKALVTANNIASFNIGRVDSDWLGTSADNTTETFQVTGGAKGSVFGDFKWDAAFTYGKSTIDNKAYGTREANLYAALYAIRDASGNIVCGPLATNPGFAANRLTNSVTLANVQPGCVPLNPFGTGNVSAAAKDYVSGIEYTKIEAIRKVASVNMSGPLFALPGGKASIAVGGELRWDSLSQDADQLQIQNVYSAGNNRPYSGRDTVKEAYAELELPVLDRLSLNGAVRRTDYKQSGAVTTWKVGGTFEPIDGLRFRATRSRDIRAPNLNDLFLVGGVSATGTFVNPFNSQSARLPVQTVGNPDLTPEKSDTFTAGVTFEGRGGISGLRLSADYFHIKVKDVIATVGATDVLARCFQGQAAYCSAITFDTSAFGIAKVFTRPFNQSLLEVQGFDFEAGYRSKLEKIGLPGEIDATVFASVLQHYKSTDIAGPTGITLEYAGYQNAAPKLTLSAFLTYKINPVTIGLQMRAFSSIKYSPLFFGPDEAGYDAAKSTSVNKNTFNGQALFNFNLAYDFTLGGKKMQLFGNVNNVFDKHPPEFAIAAINLGGNPYDYVGRTFKLGLRFEM